MVDKKQQYDAFSDDVLKYIGGKENVIEAFHCATRLRINLKDTGKVDKESLGGLDLVKGININRNQLQLIIGPGLVDEVTDEFISYTGITDLQAQTNNIAPNSAKKENVSWISHFIDDLTGVFTEILPGILAAGILIGLNNLMTQKIVGNQSIVSAIPGLKGISTIVSYGASGIFALLPLLVVYSATKRYGGRPVMGLAMGAVMMSASLPSLSDVSTGASKAVIADIFGWQLSLYSFGGQIIVALIMGWIIAKIDNYFQKHLPGVIQFVLAPMLTILVSSFILFMVVGPIGMSLSSLVTNSLVWMSTTFGIVGYMIFGGIQQLIVITGLHNMFGAVEAQLIATKGTDFLNPLFSVALMGQGGGVLAYMFLNRHDAKAKEIGLSSFFSILFGISEPALFGINIKYRYPLIGGCFGGAIGAAYVYLTKLTAISFGTTGLPGIAIASPNNNGYVNYLIANLIGMVSGLIITLLVAKFVRKHHTTNAVKQ
ncbi:PTS transporter subunit EIIC [Leuconostoc gelidum subsp. aenigmaticum]|uniref:PTS transporter subunit EIIC n=1 Tax=Leuconostoc gelidum TaxID=1244 RepID=UPI001CC65731|nr:PTS transporter subunit EIIC [Leuconostoc gelidum]MBZ6003921.1 PTS transporter subunit EIIC [Leuconostoc gelidum subsp. aenigmaticum]